MIALLLVTVFVFLIILIAIADRRPMYYDDEDEVITTTTTTTTDTGYTVAGGLKRQFDKKQPYVIDPVDGEKIWLNTTDDMYEDAAGNVWRLV